MRIAPFLFVAVMSLSACSSSGLKKEDGLHTADTASLDRSTYVAVEAKGFSINRIANGFELVIRGLDSKEPIQKIILEGAPKRMALFSSTHIGFLEAIGALDLIDGVSHKNYVYNPFVRAGIDRLEISTYGQSPEQAIEALLDSEAEVVTVSSEVMNYRPDLLEKAGKQVILIQEWKEQSPLARLEWVKVFGLLSGKLEEASAWYQQEAERYVALRDSLAAEITDTVTVLTGNSYDGTWHYAPNGYLETLIADAGGKLIGSDQNAVQALSIEQVYAYGLAADVWLNPGQHATMQSLLSEDQRYEQFVSVQGAKVYNHIARVHPDGGNDYWETGVVKPSVLLTDFRALFVGDTADLFYYQPLN